MPPETGTLLEFRWTTSRGRESYGYNICSLWINGRKVSSCNGGGYDMKGTALGNWMAHVFKAELCALPCLQPGSTRTFRQNGSERPGFYGLTFHDPHFDPGKAVPEHAPVFGSEADQGKTVAQLEAEGKSLGLERYQQFYRAATPLPSATHRVPLIDGACGMSSVTTILNALGYDLESIPTRKKHDKLYRLIKTPEAD